MALRVVDPCDSKVMGGLGRCGEAPSEPLSSGMEPVEDQEGERRRWREIQDRLAPKLEEFERVRRRAAAEAKTWWIA